MFNPPESAVKEGITKPRTFKDLRLAKAYSEEECRKIDEWRDGVITTGQLTINNNLAQVAGHYMSTSHFKSLSENTKKSYRQLFNKINSTPVPPNHTLGRSTLKKITPALCQSVYEKWVESSTANGAALVRGFSVLMSYCMSLDLVQRNPMTKVKKVTHTPESTTWTKEQVQTFLDVAFQDFKWRNVGLLVYMAYSWCQRPVDIRMLRWDNIDFTEKTVTIIQSKRGAVVTLPIHDKLLSLLRQQKEDFCFQEYVCPYQGQDKVWKPMSGAFMQDRINEVLVKAGLPESLCAGRLRTTGIQELVDADVDSTAIMSVTGHKNLTSLSSYVKPKLSAAKMALEKRGDF